MVLASQLRPGMILKVGDDVLKVVESTYHVGQGKMPGSVHAKLRHFRKGAFKELRWRPEEKLEDTSLEKQEMEFLYSDADSATFMNPTTFEQVSIIFPEIVEVKVESTAQPVHQQQDNTYKHATLENGLEVMVPQFIKPGEVVRIEVAGGKYVDRTRADSRRL